MAELERFKELIYEALSKVDESYFQTTFNNIDAFRDAFMGRMGRFLENGDFERYGERVFCYEFYHQLRILIDEEREISPGFLGESKLQAEVTKLQIWELEERLGLGRMNKDYIPDFLMHSPGNANYHPCVMEVKCNNRLDPNLLINDLIKLDQFITRYNYQFGVFLSVNTSNEQIGALLSVVQPQLLLLEGSERILVINKVDAQSPHAIFNLNQ